MKEQEKLLRVGIYERLSDEDRKKEKKENSESIKNQRHLLLEEIHKRPNFVLVDEYCDEDLSGAGTYRPEFERMIKDCENGKIDVVLCKSQSRFSRDMEIIEKYLHNKFIEWNVRFISLADNADTDNIGNKKARQINGLVNEWYLEDVSNNIRSAFHAKMKQGEFISPFAPFGYEISKNNNNQLVIDPIASIVVKKIFHLYATGLGFTAIAHFLNNQKIPSPAFYKYQKGCKLNIMSKKPIEKINWTPTTIKTILKNEVYIGNLVQGKRTTISYKNHKIQKKRNEEWIRVENTHESIIDKELFDCVQQKIQERTKPIQRKRETNLFSEKVFCYQNKHFLRKKNSSKHKYLVCSENCENYQECPCRISIRYDILYHLILREINKKIDTFYSKKELEAIRKKNQNSNMQRKVSLLAEQENVLKKEKKELQKAFFSLYDDKVKGVITLEQFQELWKEYQKKKKENAQKLYFLKQERKNSKREIPNEKKEFITINRLVIEEFIEKINIEKKNDQEDSQWIQIQWNW